MRKRTGTGLTSLSVALAVVLAFGAPGCGHGTKVINVGSSANGTTIRIHVGDHVLLRLPDPQDWVVVERPISMIKAVIPGQSLRAHGSEYQAVAPGIAHLMPNREALPPTLNSGWAFAVTVVIS